MPIKVLVVNTFNMNALGKERRNVGKERKEGLIV